MKKIIKLLISSTMTLCLVFSYNGTAHATTLKSNQSDLVSVQEYDDAMSKIYASYGIEWKVIESDDAIPITKAVYDSEFEWAYKECEEYQSLSTNIESESLSSNKVAKTDFSILSIMPAYGVNLDQWVDSGSSVTTHGTFIRANFKGFCYFSYTAVTGQHISVTVPVNSSIVVS